MWPSFIYRHTGELPNRPYLIKLKTYSSSRPPSRAALLKKKINIFLKKNLKKFWTFSFFNYLCNTETNTNKTTNIMRTFNVTAHPYFYASILVKANNEDEAMKKANEMDTDTILSELNLNNTFQVKDLLFKIHEVKANYAEPTEDENSFEVTLTITYTSSSPIPTEADDENEACVAILNMFAEESGNIDLDTDEDIYFDFIIDGKLYCDVDEDF